MAYELDQHLVDHAILGVMSGSSAPVGANPTGVVGLSAVNGSASTFLRSDGAPPLDQGIVPTWTGIHTYSAQDVHNAGVSLGTSGVVQSDLANSGTAGVGVGGFRVQNSIKLTGSRDILQANWWNGSAYQTAFRVFGQLASGLNKEMRLEYDPSNYYRMSVQSNGTTTAGPVGTAASFNFTATAGINFTGGTIVSLSVNGASGGINLGISTDYIGLYGVTPVVRPAGALQAAITNSTGGTQDGTLVDVTTVGVADPAKINDNFTDLYALVNAMRTAMVALGSMKGAA